MARDATQQPSQRPQVRGDQKRMGSLTPTEEGTYFGRYRLVEEIGVGGMASVHLARMDGAGGFQKWVALKRVHPHLVEDEHFIKMFLDEARIAASISHPNVAQVFDLGSDGNTHWIAMEYLHGEPLRELMRHNMDIGRPMRPELAARIIADAAEGLHAAHELRGKNGEPLNLVHRDVTPHNLFITYDGVVKVVDFGIAKVAGRLASTRAGTLKGKIAYMAPEQIKGREIDRRADVFALGVVLWELTTNRRLFRTDSDLETLERVQNCVVAPPSSFLVNDEYPVELEAIVMRALRKDRDDRYLSARDLSRALQQYLMAAGEFIGPAEIGAYVSKVFASRIVQREEHLRWAAEFTETFSAGHVLPPTDPTGSTTARSPEPQAARPDKPHPIHPAVPRPGRPSSPITQRPPNGPVRLPVAHINDDSLSTIDSSQTIVVTKRLQVTRPMQDASVSTATLELPNPVASHVSVSINPATDVRRVSVGAGTDDEHEDEDEDDILTRVASAGGQHQAAVMRTFVPAPVPIPADQGRDDDPTRPMPQGAKPYLPAVPVPVPVPSSLSMEAEVAGFRTPWGLYGSYVLVFTMSAVIVFAIAAVVMRARANRDDTPVVTSGTSGEVPVATPSPDGIDGEAGASPEPAPGYLTMVCAPMCEHIELGGRDLGSTASRVAMAPGQHELTLRGPNGATKVVSVVVVSGEHTVQRVSMY